MIWNITRFFFLTSILTVQDIVPFNPLFSSQGRVDFYLYPLYRLCHPEVRLASLYAYDAIYKAVDKDLWHSETRDHSPPPKKKQRIKRPGLREEEWSTSTFKKMIQQAFTAAESWGTKSALCTNNNSTSI